MKNRLALATQIYENMVCDFTIAGPDPNAPESGELIRIDFRATVQNADKLGSILSPDYLDEFEPVPTTDSEWLGWDPESIAKDHTAEQLEASIAFAKSQNHWATRD